MALNTLEQLKTEFIENIIILNIPDLSTEILLELAPEFTTIKDYNFIFMADEKLAYNLEDSVVFKMVKSKLEDLSNQYSKPISYKNSEIMQLAKNFMASAVKEYQKELDILNQIGSVKVSSDFSSITVNIGYPISKLDWNTDAVEKILWDKYLDWLSQSMKEEINNAEDYNPTTLYLPEFLTTSNLQDSKLYSWLENPKNLLVDALKVIKRYRENSDPEYIAIKMYELMP